MSTEQIDLPELTADRVDAIERDLFRAIADERASGRSRHRQRTRRGWLTTGAAAAVIAVAAFAGPALMSGSGTSGDAASTMDTGAGGATAEQGAEDLGQAQSVPEQEASGAESARDVVATARATLETSDAAAAAAQIATRVEDAGGYVETLTLPASPSQTADADDVGYVGGAWMTVRVPASDLPAVTAMLDDIGDVASSELQREDVTSQTVDLRARVGALERSVDRLGALVEEADSTADLLTAEGALAERQAELDGLRAQLTALDSQVAMSTLTITFTQPAASVAAADPAGFGDGLSAGWNGLVATLNGIIVGLGFLLPWLVLIGVGIAAVRLIVRIRHRRTTGQEPDPSR
ncbi:MULTISPECIES: DUF4349 domain-containing protein [unclassified Microbacterium]|uniref:DUF4349 domain-containing protein n=1 Tax=unclassified Microbacterium TaxID=2609290 RepID=UPI003867F6C6